MARRLRLFIADMPYHVIQRGNNKNPIFFNSKDYSFFLNVLREAKTKHPCFIYGYCLMTNHFHLLIQPKEKDNISLLMKLLGAKYVRYVNDIHERTGTLWEGRFKCSLIDREAYFLAVLRYIEMNPVTAGIVNAPELYSWSSYRVRAFGEKSRVLDLDSWYNDLDPDVQQRQFKYRNFFQSSLTEDLQDLIKEMADKNGIVGSDEFREEIGQKLGKKITFRPPGRPKDEEK